MLSYIDPILFPDECLVYEVEPHRYVYPIFKNGSSSLTADSRLLSYEELGNIGTVEVFIREPFERYVSGVQTYLRYLPPQYDRDTMLKVIWEFLFLNRHFAPQYYWLVNFTRFSDALMHFKPMDELHTATEHTFNILARDESLVEYFKYNDKLHFYLTLDKTINTHFMGKIVEFREVTALIKEKYPTVYYEVIQRNIDLCNALG